jgi:hypothetical protein
MSEKLLSDLIFIGGIANLSILIASALVPFRLKWREEFRPLSPLHRQMFWVYGGYVVLAIVSLGLISIFNAQELARGSGLARGFCGYAAAFWGIRLALQGILDVKEHLTAWWLRLGYHGLSVMFVFLTLLYGWAALRPAG